MRFVGPDALFNYKLLSASNNVCQIHAPLYKYRIHETLNNASQNSNVKQQIDDYLNTLHFDESFLTKINLSKEELVETFVNDLSLNRSLSFFLWKLYASC